MSAALEGKRYKHYKGKHYKVLSIARHSETLEEMVVYQAEYDSDDFGRGAIWVRPKNMFEEKVHIQGETIDRFLLLD